MNSYERDPLPAPGLPELGSVVGGRYRIDAVLGSGATGVVYAATHELTGKLVAIKWLRPNLASNDTLTTRFLREASAAAAIDHPNVVAVFDAGRERGSLFLVMERLRGEPFSKFLERGPHTPDVLIASLMPALRGVAAAHEHGIVHRDLKPDNVFLPERRRGGGSSGAKVLDFGISKLRKPADGRELTPAGTFLGSPVYTAPEQIVESREADARSDVYSLGVMLYEGLTRRLPFQARSLPELFEKVLFDQPTPLETLRSDLPSGLADVVMRALTRDPDARIGSIEELAHALEPFTSSARFSEEERSESRTSFVPIEGGRTEIARTIDESGNELEEVSRANRIDGVDVLTQPAIRMPNVGSWAPPAKEVITDPAVLLGTSGSAPLSSVDTSFGPAPVRPENQVAASRRTNESSFVSLPESLRGPEWLAVMAFVIFLLGLVLGLALGR